MNTDTYWESECKIELPHGLWQRLYRVYKLVFMLKKYRVKTIEIGVGASLYGTGWKAHCSVVYLR